MNDSRLLLLGTPVLVRDGESVLFVAERRFQLLGYLALSGDWVERDRLAGLFWPDHDETAARRNLRKIVYRARESAWLGGLESRGDSLSWRVENDVEAFRIALSEQRVADACTLYRGALGLGLDDASIPAFTAWLGARRASLHLQWRDAVLTALPALPEEEKADAARRLVEDDPFDERAVLSCLTALHEQSKVDEAEALYRDYVRRLATELGVEPSAHVREAMRSLLERSRYAVVAKPSRAGEVAPPAVARDAFIGRRLELQELLALLRRPECRVVTVFGPGGIGKSRLVRAALAPLVAMFAGGARWVSLEDLHTETAVMARVAQALGVSINDAGDPIMQIAARCAHRDELLLFDNAEHLTSLGDLLQRLLTAWPALRLLITSRTRVGLDAEWLLPLGGLAIPDADSRDFAAASNFDAVRLFDVRARTVRPEFDLAKQLDAVIDVVERVDGLPLAIELAAAWLRLLPAQEIARELKQSFELLQQTPLATNADVTGRHTNTRAVFDHSWKLLSPSECEALAQLSIFRGGFRREAAAAVAGANLALLASLSDKSLVMVDSEGRFGLHPLVAFFAAQQLNGAPTLGEACALRHATYWAHWLDERASLAARDPAALVQTVTTERANCEVAWRYIAQHGRPDLGALMLPALHASFTTSGRWTEGCNLLHEALSDVRDDAGALDFRMRLLTALAGLHYSRGDVHDTEAFSQASLDVARRLDHRDTIVRSLVHLGISLTLRGNAVLASPPLEEALAIAREGRDRNRIANVLFNLALAERMLGGYGRAMALNEEALAFWRETGNADGIACALTAVGNLQRIAGRLDDARATQEASLSLCRTHRLEARSWHVRMNLGHALIELGQTAAAREHLEACLYESEAHGQLPMLILAQLRLCRLDLAEVNACSARARCGWIVRTAHSRGLDGFAMEGLALFAQCCDLTGEHGTAMQLRPLLADSILLDRAERDDVQRRLRTAVPASKDSAPALPSPLTLAEAVALVDAQSG